MVLHHIQAFAPGKTKSSKISVILMHMFLKCCSLHCKMIYEKNLDSFLTFEFFFTFLSLSLSLRFFSFSLFLIPHSKYCGAVALTKDEMPL